MKKCLIIVRAGDESLHPGWRQGADERSFDLLVSYYGLEPDRYREESDYYHWSPGPRWPAHREICAQQWELLMRYEYIAFACDDLKAGCSTWNRLFDLCREYSLDLAQPAIEGPVSHSITMPQAGCLLRLTNFVEIMCPIFHRRALEIVRWTFGESQSGWGLEFLWSTLLPHPRYKLAIIDSAPVLHTRGLGQGSLQQVLGSRGIVNHEEMAGLLSKHAIRRFELRNYEYLLPPSPSDTPLLALYESLGAEQQREICFDWSFRDPSRGLLRAFLSNHWQITRPSIRSEFFTPKQQGLIHEIFRSLLKPEWYPAFVKQLHDDTKGHPWGTNQSIGIFGAPGRGPCQLVITGRHLTLRADGNADSRAAFGGPILYGHAASGYWEKPGHPGNIFWRQAQAATRVYTMLDPYQRVRATVPKLPAEAAIAFQGPRGYFPGIPVSELTHDQLVVLGQVMEVLLEPFRTQERWLTFSCLQQCGGIHRCSLAFYAENQMSDDAWDSWRLEGPAFVWYFRGVPHVHVWVHISHDFTDPVVSRTGTFIDRQHDPLL